MLKAIQVEERPSERLHHDGGEGECSRLDRETTPQCGAHGHCHKHSPLQRSVRNFRVPWSVKRDPGGSLALTRTPIRASRGISTEQSYIIQN